MRSALRPLWLALALCVGCGDSTGIPIETEDPGVTIEGGGRVGNSDPESLSEGGGARGSECRVEKLTTYRDWGPATDEECTMLSGVVSGECEGLTYMAMSTGFASFIYYYDDTRTLVGLREFTDDFSFCTGSSTRTWGAAPGRDTCAVWTDGAQMCPGKR